MSHDLETSVVDWLIDFPEIAPLLQELRLDASCGGISLEYACQQAGHSPKLVLQQLRDCIAANALPLFPPNNSSEGTVSMTTSTNPAGAVIPLLAEGDSDAKFQAQTIARLPSAEIKHLTLPAGKELPTHTSPGELIIQSLSGRVLFSSLGTSKELAAGQLLWLNAGEPHAVQALEDSTLLVTIVKPQSEPN